MASVSKWRGCKDIQMRYYNEWSEPDILYTDKNGTEYEFASSDVEDGLWNSFLEENNYTDDMSGNEKIESEFTTYVQNHGTEYLEDMIFGGYFSEGSTSWHDK